MDYAKLLIGRPRPEPDMLCENNNAAIEGMPDEIARNDPGRRGSRHVG
jgi:hypothetical protein